MQPNLYTTIVSLHAERLLSPSPQSRGVESERTRVFTTIHRVVVDFNNNSNTKLYVL